MHAQQYLTNVDLLLYELYVYVCTYYYPQFLPFKKSC